MVTSPEQDLSTSTKLAIERTRLAHERTLMAWVRTATSLISFGFSVYKFFQYLSESQGAPPERGNWATGVRRIDDWDGDSGTPPRPQSVTAAAWARYALNMERLSRTRFRRLSPA
jgi:hypothetical protein